MKGHHRVACSSLVKIELLLSILIVNKYPRKSLVSIQMACDESKLIFTRYLYSLDDAKHSLFVSILNKNSDESLFWLYEIYYSGFKTDAFQMVMNVFTDVFSFDNPDLTKPFHRIMKNYEETPSEADSVSIGTMVHNLCLRKYRIEYFMKTYIGIVCEPSTDTDVTKKHLYITLTRDNIQKYETKPSMEKPHLYLREVCKYSAHKETNAIFGEARDGLFKDLYINHWLYFAYKSPIWKERVEAYGGKPVHDQKKIVFYNEAGEEDEDLTSEFYDQWNMETDEQPVDVINKSTGVGAIQYMTVTDFCRKYGGVMKTKKLARKIKTMEALSISMNSLAL